MHQADLVADRALAQALLDLLVGELAVLEVLVQQLFVGFGGGLDHLVALLVALAPCMSSGISRYSKRMPCVASSQ